MNQKEFVMAALDTVQQQLIAAESCMANNEHFNALSYIVNAQIALSTTVIHLFISQTNKILADKDK